MQGRQTASEVLTQQDVIAVVGIGSWLLLLLCSVAVAVAAVVAVVAAVLLVVAVPGVPAVRAVVSVLAVLAVALVVAVGLVAGFYYSDDTVCFFRQSVGSMIG